MMSNAIFVPTVFVQTNSTLFNKFSRISWGYAKDVYTCFVDLEKAQDRVPREKLWKVLREYGVDGPCCWPSSHCTAAQKFASVSGGINLNRSPWELDASCNDIVGLLFMISCHKNFCFTIIFMISCHKNSFVLHNFWTTLSLCRNNGTFYRQLAVKSYISS